jgi:hypothetical protein
MKQFLLSLTAILSVAISKGQFNENFDGSTISSLTSNCWVLNGSSTTTTSGEAINGTSIFTAPSTNSGSKVDIYTPVMTLLSSTMNMSYDYRLTAVLGGNATRSIQIGLVNMNGNLIASDILTIVAGNTTNVLHYTHTFSALSLGNYRMVYRIYGSNGNGNVRVILDNFDNTNILPAINIVGCVLVPILESTLPVKLASFTAILNKNNNVDLKWITYSELNVSHFVVERSIDGINFNDDAMVFAYGNSTDTKTYSFADNISGVASSVVFYRLRAVDTDGKTHYSETRMIRLSKQTSTDISISAFPNPMMNELRISIPAEWQNKKVTYEVMNANGQVAQKMETANSSQVENINTSKLSSGFYIVRATCDGQTAQQKIVKQ